MALPELFTLFAVQEPETQAIAASLAAVCQTGDCIALRGDLGAGKTSFARGFIQALAGEKEEIVSPTFTLVQSYEVRTRAGEAANLWHCDLYRLKEPEEVEELGLYEALGQAMTLIEWPELIESHLPAGRLEITLWITGDDRRGLRFCGGPEWAARLAPLKK